MADNVTALVPAHAQPPAQFFTPEQERMILTTFLGGATKDEARVLLEVVKRRRLDPFSRQVYFVKRYDMQKREEVWAIQTSIDGLRSIAERTGKYDGQDEPEFGEDDAGKFCKVRVYRKDWSANRAAVGVAYLSEFIQKKKDGSVTQFWARMPRLMLAKCAEALAIRKAFPEDTGGLYISEEMGQEPPAETQQPEPKRVEVVEVKSEPVAEPPKQLEPKKTAPPPYVVALWQRAQKEFGKVKGAEAFAAAARDVFGLEPKPSSEWTKEEAEQVTKALFDIQY